MADIQITCPKCSKTVTVSEFTDPANLTCHACGEPLKKPDLLPKQKSKPTAKKAAIEETNAETAQTPEGQGVGGNWQLTQQAAIKKRPKERFHMSPPIWGWVIFVFLGGLMAYLRYFGGFLADNTDMIRTYGPIVVITIHVMIVVKAFRDSVFQGVLCFLVPLYSLYYLFFVADDFYLRGITGGLLIGIGQESAAVFNEEFQRVMKMASDWIGRGGD